MNEGGTGEQALGTRWGGTSPTKGGGEGEPRRAAGTGVTGAIRPCRCPFPYSVKTFEDFFRSKTKQINPRLVHLRRAARAASRTHNLLIFPANIGELHNGI